MDEPSLPVVEPPQLPRWAQVVAGLLLLPLASLCLMGSVSMVISPPPKSPLLAAALGAVFVLTTLWVFGLAFRLIANRPNRGGLMGPFALRCAALLFFALPIGGLFTGYIREKPLVAVLQTVSYVLIATALLRIARSRSHAV